MIDLRRLATEPNEPEAKWLSENGWAWTANMDIINAIYADCWNRPEVQYSKN